MGECVVDKVKQIIVFRKDLRMRTGKIAAQCAHSAMMFVIERLKEQIDSFDINGDHSSIDYFFTEAERDWLFNDAFTKIVCSVDTLEELLELHEKAKVMGIVSHIVEDSGLTEFHGQKTVTCASFGPDYSSKLNPLTKDLKLA